MAEDIRQLDWRITGVDILDDGKLLFLRIETKSVPENEKHQKIVTLVDVDAFVDQVATRIATEVLSRIAAEGGLQ